MSDPKARLLIVDDDETNRHLLCTYLRKSGYEALGAVDGNTALEALQTAEFDLVLLDMMMPGMTGMETLSIIRQSFTQNQLPVIMATARSESSDVVEALNAGANDYVTKPFDMPVLLARISTRLSSDKGGQSSTVPPPPPAAPVVTEPKLRDLKAGSVIAERYRLDEKIGAGTFGTVYRGVHLQLESDVAIKVLQIPEQDEEALARFRQEGVSACRIQHPNAVAISDFGVTSAGVAYLVMELLEGEDLDDVLQRDQVLSPKQCAEILMPTCFVLAEAHARGIVHRDIKPGNIFLAKRKGQTVVKVLDFGIAKFVGEESSAVKQTQDRLLGTPAYMAPERVQSQAYDGRADVYALGVMLYEMLSGLQPFAVGDAVASAVAQVQMTATPLDAVTEDAWGNPLQVSPAVARVVERAMAKDPTERPSVELLAVDFSQAARS